jgi:hypothetical protein
MALCCLRIFSFLFSWSKDMPITLGNTDITGLTGALVMPDINDSSLVGPVIRNFGTDGSTAGVFFQGYDWVQGGIWHGRNASGTNRSGALVLGTNPNTADLSKQGLVGRLIINNAGQVQIPATPAFHVWHSVGPSGFPSSSTATWDSVITNNGSHFKTTAGTGQNQRFIAPVAGYYHFNVQMLSNSGTQLFYRIRKNGTDVPGTYVETYSASAFQTANSTATISLAANDFVEVFVSTNAAYGNVYANFNGFLIG